MNSAFIRFLSDKIDFIYKRVQVKPPAIFKKKNRAGGTAFNAGQHKLLNFLQESLSQMKIFL